MSLTLLPFGWAPVPCVRLLVTLLPVFPPQAQNAGLACAHLLPPKSPHINHLRCSNPTIPPLFFPFSHPTAPAQAQGPGLACADLLPDDTADRYPRRLPPHQAVSVCVHVCVHEMKGRCMFVCIYICVHVMQGCGTCLYLQVRVAVSSGDLLFVCIHTCVRMHALIRTKGRRC